MSRGIPEAAARGILVTGFIGELIDDFGDDALAGYLQQWLKHWHDRDGGDSDD